MSRPSSSTSTRPARTRAKQAACRCIWVSPTKAATRAKAASTRSTTASTPAPAPSACAPCSTTRMASSCPACMHACASAAVNEREAMLINEKAVGTDQAKRFVLVVDKDNKSAYREVKTGATQDGLIIVESGLEPGERIVVNGLQRVRPGAPVDAADRWSMEDGQGRPPAAGPPTPTRRPCKNRPPLTEKSHEYFKILHRPAHLCRRALGAAAARRHPLRCSSCPSPNTRKSCRPRWWCARSIRAPTPR